MRKTEGEFFRVKLPPELIRQVDHLAVDWRLSRGPAMERLLRAGLEETEMARMAQERAGELAALRRHAESRVDTDA